MVNPIELTPDQLKELAAAYSDLKKEMSDTSASDAARGAMGRMGTLLGDITKKAGLGTVAVAAFASKLDKSTFDGFIKKLEGLKEQFMMKAATIGGANVKRLAYEITGLIGIATGRLEVSKEILELGKVAEGSSAQMAGMFERLGKLAPELTKELPKLTAAFQRTFAQVDAARNMETAILMNAAAGGGLVNTMGSLGGKLEHTTGEMKNLSDLSIDFSRQMRDIGTANNLTSGQVTKYATALMRIPGALSMTVKGLGASKDSMNLLDATLRVAAGTFQSFEDVMKDVDLLFNNWNKTGRESLTFVSRLHSAAQSLQMPMTMMRDYVHGVGNQFKFLGDNTQGAIDIMTKMGPAFRASGLGPQAVGELMKGMTRAVSEMDVAQRAFLSAQTGGPGGLRGGYEIAAQLQEGGLADVMGKTFEGLKGMFGGEVVTLEEARQDDRAAAQLTKQVQMLTQGPLAVAKTEQEAFKILEAFSRGDMEGAAAALTEEDALQSAVSRGNEIQERQINEMVQMNNELEFQSNALAIAVYGRTRTRGLIGDEGRTKRARDIRGSAQAAATRAPGKEFMVKTPRGAVAAEAERATDKGKELLDRFGGFVESVTEVNIPGVGRREEPGGFTESEAVKIRASMGQEEIREYINTHMQAPPIEAIAGDIRGISERGPAGRGREERGTREREQAVVIQLRSEEVLTGIKRNISAMIKDGKLQMQKEEQDKPYL